MTDPTILHGRCFCGAVQFTLTPPLDFVAHCHCESCRRSHAAAFVTWTSVPRGCFVLLEGEGALTWYASSPAIEWGFCGRCGSSMLYRAVQDGHPEGPRTSAMYVAAASLTDSLPRAPSVHVSWEEHAPWLVLRDGLPKHRGKTDEIMEEDTPGG